VPGLHQLRDGADRVLDRDSRVEARGPVDVHVVSAEALQRVGQKGFDGGGTPVDAEHAAVWVTQHAELHAQRNLLPVAGAQGSADQPLVVAHSVEITCVQHRHAGIDRGVDRRDTLRVVRRTVRARHPHAPQPKSRDLRAVSAQLPRFHDTYPFVGGLTDFRGPRGPTRRSGASIGRGSGLSRRAWFRDCPERSVPDPARLPRGARGCCRAKSLRRSPHSTFVPAGQPFPYLRGDEGVVHLADSAAPGGEFVAGLQETGGLLADADPGGGTGEDDVAG